MMHIRLATKNDISAILDISNHYARTTPANFAVEPEPLEVWQQSFDTTHVMFPWLVAEDRSCEDDPARSVTSGATSDSTHPLAPSLPGRGNVLGFAKASPWKGRCAYAFAAEISVYIKPEACGRGIGRALYVALFSILNAQGYCTLLAGITLPNEASVKLHESMGMKRVALLERIGWKFDRWHDVGYWQVQLNGDDAAPPTIRAVHDVAPSMLQRRDQRV